MSDSILLLLSKGIFGGSVLLVLYLVYREIKMSKIKAEEAEISLGEKENEDLVNGLTPDELIAKVNADLGDTTDPQPGTPPKKR
jgi:hypothetical protein